MTNAFVRKLLRGVDLTARDQQRLIAATSRTETIAPRVVLMREGELNDGGCVLLSGFATCSKLLTNGGRQIVAYRVPGDADGLYGIHTEHLDYTVVTLTPCDVAFISRATIDDWLADSPGIARALWWSLLTEKSYLCGSLTNIGQRPGAQRLAYLICELLSRLRAVGLERTGSFEVPLTYQDFADILGFGEVHACRAFRQLREVGVLTDGRASIVVTDVDRLKCFADFDLTCY
ncbi:MAG: Crp/Fnr family transcriptional regulator [Methylobacterium sp.]|uniref:Crp/Fnr family transcriptional regulator n=1 Tax=Methylobacterium sp. TaxID=409 RepID=UPI00258874E7|nr:Crp/Fnr family transcriptional regulator [Methylobacterium sp.]MBY0296677.1 Crp/Fnr family transcriptional regulator [Methylobacterium sp.]